MQLLRYTLFEVLIKFVEIIINRVIKRDVPKCNGTFTFFNISFIITRWNKEYRRVVNTDDTVSSIGVYSIDYPVKYEGAQSFASIPAGKRTENGVRYFTLLF